MAAKIPLVIVRFRSLDANKLTNDYIDRRNQFPNLDEGSSLSLYGYKKLFRKSVDVSDKLWMLSLLSARINIKNVDQTILEISNSSNVQENFQKTYTFIRKYWHDNYPVNILFLGGDVIARQELIFPDSNFFQMYNFANITKDHESRSGDRNIIGGDKYFSIYCNADVRYYSHKMTEEVWNVGDAWFQNWETYWEYEQDLYNAMMRSQNLEENQIISPHLAYQLPANEVKDVNKLKAWNNIDLDEADLVHLHSTRGSDKALKIARSMLVT